MLLSEYGSRIRLAESFWGGPGGGFGGLGGGFGGPGGGFLCSYIEYIYIYIYIYVSGLPLPGPPKPPLGPPKPRPGPPQLGLSLRIYEDPLKDI